LIFAEVFDGELGEFLGRVFDEVAENVLLVVSDDEDFPNRRNFSDGSEAVPDDRVACNVKEGLVEGYRQRTRSSTAL
jgi:hypothetical protein